MFKNNLPSSIENQQEQLLLKAKIEVLKQELALIHQKINSFEAILRSHLINELIEEQELTVLYKQLQKEKKEKRLAQKKRGKNFKEVEGVTVISENSSTVSSEKDQKEIKHLYREAMIQVHPDKFSMQEEKQDLATEITTHLIEIYQSGSLEKLQEYHTHIFSGNVPMQFEES